ncbi:MAG: hypothetical protein HRU71_02315 [Planctomycetia bacterium]|nr:MAG: hypothetical protein HRU71_02315 [Planctomycetia bacterium]
MIAIPADTSTDFRDRFRTRTVLASALLGTILLGAWSDGAYHDDDLTHFLMARWAAVFPGYLLNIWGRPGFTIPAAAVAWIGSPETGWHAVRVLSALVTAASALLAARTARRLGIAPGWLVVLICYVQPLNTVLAATSLTENFAALYLMAAVYLLLGGRAVTASAVFSLVLVSRHETVALVPVWWLGIWIAGGSVGRRGLALAASIAAPALHNVVFFVAYRAWPFQLFLAPSGSTQYPPTGPFAYLPHLFVAVPFAIATFALLGVRRVATARFMDSTVAATTHPNGGEAMPRAWIIPALAATFVMIHIVVMAAGVFASGGYARFMVTIAPLMAILAAAGMSSSARAVTSPASGAPPWLSFAGMTALAWLAVEIEFRAGRLGIRDGRFLVLVRVFAGATLVLMIAGAFLRHGAARHALSRIAMVWLIALVLVQNAAMIRPLRLNDPARAVARLVDWIRTRGLNDRPIFATNSWFAYFFDWAEDPRAHKGRRLVASMPVGTLVIWDSIYSASDYHRLPLELFDHNPAYHRLHEMTSAGTRPIQLIVFEKVAETPVPSEPDVSYPPNLANQQDETLGRYYRHERS